MNKSYKRTDQQEEIVQSEENVLVVNALAGTGKTSSLVDFSKARPNKKIIYLAYNSSIAQEAKAKFPPNVKVMTSNGMAFSVVGHLYAEFGKLVNSIKTFDVINALKLKDRQDFSEQMVYLYAIRLIESLNTFISRPEPEMTPDMVEIKENRLEKKSFDPAAIIKDAMAYWEMMVDLENKSVGMTHDGYMKLYLLYDCKVREYDYVLFDEAQDTTPVTLSIVNKMPGKKVFVGDRNQAIYGFRGAVDALDRIEASKSLALTKSFRFGDRIAATSNLLLSVNNSKHYLSGLGGPDEVGSLPIAKEYAFLSRSNAGLIMHADSALRSGKSIHFIGGVEKYRFDDLMSVYHLKFNNRKMIKDPFVAAFDSFDDFAETVKASGDVEYGSRVRIVNEYNRRLPEILSSITRGCEATTKSNANVVFTTAHKSKGLEFDHVLLADDFLSNDSLFEDVATGLLSPKINVEEVNIAYVAATRAMKKLNLAMSEVFNLIENHHEIKEKAAKNISAYKANMTVTEDNAELLSNRRVVSL